MSQLYTIYLMLYIDSLVQNCSNPIVNVLELLLSCTEPLICNSVI